MGKFPKFLGIACVTLFVASLTGPGSDFYYGTLRPLSAVLFILFFVTRVLEKEVALYDREQASKERSLGTAPKSTQTSSQDMRGTRGAPAH